MQPINTLLSIVAGYVWWPVLFLIMGGGLFFLFYSRFIQYRYFFHAWRLLAGSGGDDNGPGQISAYKALATALASTVGMGNLSGVAAAIALGGPGAMFWMWMTAVVGMSTNFFTSTLASLYRGKDSNGELQGGPMYVIREALDKKFMPLAFLFCVCCMVGALPIFSANQLTQALVDIGLPLIGVKESFVSLGVITISIQKLILGIAAAILVAVVIIGGIQRIGTWAGNMVPWMIVLHFISVVIILSTNLKEVPHYFGLIFTDAFAAHHFHGDPFLGGTLGGLIMLGVRRATFSNEAGIGTAPMAMGASKSSEPVREGLLSMLSPVIDTIVSCSLTAMAILTTGVWETTGASGITLTSMAYKKAMPYGGDVVLLICASVFAISAMFSYSYYGRKALAFIIGENKSRWYDYFYIFTIVLGSVVSLEVVLNLIDISFALMAIPTMTSAFILAPGVMREAKKYVAKLN